MSQLKHGIDCRVTVKDGLAVVVYMICMTMIATISWHNYYTSTKLEHIIQDIQARQIIGSGAHYVGLGRIENQISVTSAD